MAQHSRMTGNEPAYYDRRPAASGALPYGDRLVVRDTTRVLIEAIPFFIPHANSAAELSMKLVRTDRKSGEQTEMTLNSADLYALKRHIGQSLVVAEQPDDGQYIVLQTDRLAAQLDISDDAVGAIGAALESRHLAARIARDANPQVLAEAFSAVVRIGELRSAITELQEHLSEGRNREDVYQDWCERHSWAFGNAYVARDDQRVIGIGDQVDLLMQSTASGLRDVYELKRPNMDVILYDDGHHNWYWSAHTAKAIGQCHRYLDTLHRAAENGLHPARRDIVAYHPRAVIIIGRSNDWDAEKLRALHGLNSRMHGITVMTYDQLVSQCHVLLDHVSDSASRSSGAESGGLLSA